MSTAIRLQVNGTMRELSATGGVPTVAVLIEMLGLGARRVAVEHNGEIVPKAQHAQHALADGDTVEVVTFVGGG